MNKILLIVVLALSVTAVKAQEEPSDKKIPFDLGIEAQLYPTGFLLGTRLEKGITLRDAINLRIGYNFVNHRDWGVKMDERGGGAGFTIGYRRYFKDYLRGLFLGARNDIWFNSIDWKDEDENGNETSGNSKITVVQPTIELGYQFLLKNEYWVIAPNIAFGYEINVKTEGEEVGEGAILLLGVSALYRFQ